MRETCSGKNRNTTTIHYGERILYQYFIIMNINILFEYLFQYYEMSYGLNVEMHKQVRFLYIEKVLNLTSGQISLKGRCQEVEKFTLVSCFGQFCRFSGVLSQCQCQHQKLIYIAVLSSSSLYFFCLKFRILAGHFEVKFYHETPINQTDTARHHPTTSSFVTSRLFVVNFYEPSTSFNL